MPSDSCGLLLVGGLEIAVPLAALREVVPAPEQLAALPGTGPRVRGATELRGLVVPVVQLTPTAAEGVSWRDQVVVVMHHEGRVMGLLADGVLGISDVGPEARLALHAAGGAGPQVFSHTFFAPELGSVVTALDPAALFADRELVSVQAPQRTGTGPATVEGGASGSGRGATSAATYTLLRCGAYALGIDIANVHTTVASFSTEPSVLAGSYCLGVSVVDDREVPVVDPLALLGLGRTVDHRGPGIVLELATGFVVLAVDALLDLRVIAGADVLALPAFAVPRRDLVRGLSEVAGVGSCLVLDRAALHEDEALRTLAGLNTAIERAPSSSGDPAAAFRARGGMPHVAYSAGLDVVTPIEQVDEVVAMPAELTALATSTGLLGIFVHREEAIPVVCLATVLGRTPDPAPGGSCVLLVHAEGRATAFKVDALSSIVVPSWEDPEPHDRPAARVPAQALRASPLVAVGESGRLLPVLDLRALVRLLHGEDPAAAPLALQQA